MGSTRTTGGANGGTTSWRNWAGTAACRPARVVAPGDAAETADEVRRAVADGLTVKAVGTGHSFTPVAVTGGVLVRPERMTGAVRLDPAAGTVTVGAGTPLKALNRALEAAGWSLTNMGDIAEQTVAGAVSTGTHGTGRSSAALAAQVTALELVTAGGSVLRCSAAENPEVFTVARVGLGALGVVTSLTFAVEPSFLLTAREEPMRLERVLADFDGLAAENEHFEFYWFPHTDRCTAKRNNRSPGPAAPLPRLRGWVDDELLSNHVFQAVSSLGRAVPAAVPAIARLSSRALSARAYTDTAHRVFTSPRRVRFVEMEYALPREAAVPALREVRAAVERSGLRVGFPVEVRVAPADDVPLSGGFGRETAYIAVHQYKGVPYRDYFALVEPVMTAHGGRPHWGKVHTRDAGYLAEAHPSMARFTAVRDRLDPGRVFGNAYLERVLGS